MVFDKQAKLFRKFGEGVEWFTRTRDEMTMDELEGFGRGGGDKNVDEGETSDAIKFARSIPNRFGFE